MPFTFGRKSAVVEIFESTVPTKRGKGAFVENEFQQQMLFHPGAEQSWQGKAVWQTGNLPFLLFSHKKTCTGNLPFS